MTNPNTESKVKNVRAALAKAVRAARAGKELSQVDVAERARVSVARVSEIENGTTDPRLSTLVRVGAVLGIEIIVRDAA